MPMQLDIFGHVVKHSRGDCVYQNPRSDYKQFIEAFYHYAKDSATKTTRQKVL